MKITKKTEHVWQACQIPTTTDADLLYVAQAAQGFWQAGHTALLQVQLLQASQVAQIRRQCRQLIAIGHPSAAGDCIDHRVRLEGSSKSRSKSHPMSASCASCVGILAVPAGSLRFPEVRHRQVSDLALAACWITGAEAFANVMLSVNYSGGLGSVPNRPDLITAEIGQQTGNGSQGNTRRVVFRTGPCRDLPAAEDPEVHRPQDITCRRYT